MRGTGGGALNGFWVGFLAGAPLWVRAGAVAAMHLMARRNAVTVRAPGETNEENR